MKLKDLIQDLQATIDSHGISAESDVMFETFEDLSAGFHPVEGVVIQPTSQETPPVVKLTRYQSYHRAHPDPTEAAYEALNG